MRVAVTHENGMVFGHFGKTPQFKMYEVNDGKVVSSEVLDTNGAGHGALAGFLQEAKADVLICGGIGGGAIMALSGIGVEIYAGASGQCDDVISQYLQGNLPQNGDATCDHHEHHHDHDHDCGHENCCNG